MQSNIPDGALTWLVGAAFLTCLIGMVATLTLPQERTLHDERAVSP